MKPLRVKAESAFSEFSTLGGRNGDKKCTLTSKVFIFSVYDVLSRSVISVLLSQSKIYQEDLNNGRDKS